MQFHVENMTCGGCARSVTAAIREVDASARVEADPASRKVVVESSATAEAIRQALAGAGFDAASL